MAVPTLLYDDACPMCKAYTAGFQRAGWCDRAAFSGVGERGAAPGLDLDRARHEIPLVDPATGTVYYGLDAMTRVMAGGMPVLKPILRSPLLRMALTPLYKIITYNRRLIAGTHAPAAGFDCAPDRHVGWRWTYIALMLLITGCLGLPTLFGGIAIIGGIVGLYLTPDRLSYLGHYATVLFLAAVALYVLPAPVAPIGASLLIGYEAHRRLNP
ncbi:uncharacterized protein DUF393 [Neolewinella xylanilytica]|uniref:Uncharacterized protein DUF393 n=1 Tax=Neolewinella xylanilytica TaxID=1514080 RepID=A0A2S6IA47_9BACT|nr:DCC1-like thiol-disulfide oxidoreductase family protein [Neolewinella xylanilytica]PPK88377.1 uncharacterized protein DUF393 [Neolewinella xylanilytica]